LLFFFVGGGGGGGVGEFAGLVSMTWHTSEEDTFMFNNFFFSKIVPL